MDRAHQVDTAVPAQPRLDIGDWLSGAATGDGDLSFTAGSPESADRTGHWLRRILPRWFGGARSSSPVVRD